MFLSPFDPYPVTRPLGFSTWDDPFLTSDLLSPFSLLPAQSLTSPALDVLPPSSRVVPGIGNELKAIFDDLEGYDSINIAVDEVTSCVTVRARDTRGTARARRWVTLPCALQHCGKITAEQIGGRVIVTIPEECQKAPEALPEAQKARPLKVTLRPDEMAVPPQFETSQDDKGYHIKASGVKKDEDPDVHVNGSRLSLTCKASEGETPFSRVFRLPRMVKDPNAIEAKLEENNLIITVPDSALEAEKEPATAKIEVKKAMST